MDNKDQEDQKEKEMRSFTLKVLFIVIVGLSAVAFIFKFRQAKNEIKKHVEAEKEFSSKSSQPEEVKKAKRVPQEESQRQRETDKTVKKRKLIPAKRDKRKVRPFQKSSSKTLYQLNREKGDIRLKDEEFSINSESYLEVENIFAVKEEFKDSFNEEDILYQRGPYVLIKAEDYPTERESLRVAYNRRTAQLGLITGQVILRFLTASAFENRKNLFVEGIEERANYSEVLTSIVFVETKEGLSEIEKLGTYWRSLPDLKAVEIEILEAQIVIK